MKSLKDILLENKDELLDKAKIVLAIKMPDGNTELIINQNAIEKLNYIEKAYDENLRLKNNPNISIESYMFYV